MKWKKHKKKIFNLCLNTYIWHFECSLNVSCVCEAAYLVPLSVLEGPWPTSSPSAKRPCPTCTLILRPVLTACWPYSRQGCSTVKRFTMRWGHFTACYSHITVFESLNIFICETPWLSELSWCCNPHPSGTPSRFKTTQIRLQTCWWFNPDSRNCCWIWRKLYRQHGWTSN